MKKSVAKAIVFVIMGLVLSSQTSYGTEPNASIRGTGNVDSEYITPYCLTSEKYVIADLISPTGTCVLEYVSTFDQNFLAKSFCPICALSSTRISIAKYNPNGSGFAPLHYLIEFPAERIDSMPDNIKAVLATFYKVPTSQNLYATLKGKSVDNIFISACGFGPVPRSCIDSAIISNFNIIPHAFLGLQLAPKGGYFNGNVTIGLFNNINIIPANPNPISVNVLTGQSLSYHAPDSLSGDVLRCQFLDSNNPASFYVVVITPDKKNISITQVLMTNNKDKTQKIANAFRDSTSFLKLLSSLNSMEQNKALASTVKFLKEMSK